MHDKELCFYSICQGGSCCRWRLRMSSPEGYIFCTNFGSLLLNTVINYLNWGSIHMEGWVFGFMNYFNLSSYYPVPLADENTTVYSLVKGTTIEANLINDAVRFQSLRLRDELAFYALLVFRQIHT